MNKNLFISRMKLHGDTQESLATYLNKAVPTVCNKINGKSKWDDDEIKRIKIRYDLTAEDVYQIFLS